MFRKFYNILKYKYFYVLFHYGTPIALMGVIFFHVNDVKAIEEKVLSEAELKEDFTPKRQNKIFPF
jgi:hypothetical protein